MKAIILSAGQGSRLLPLTKNKPKCLLPLDDQYTVLSWQLTQLEAAGVEEVVVVTGFQSAQVDAQIAAYNGKIKIRSRYNPFYSVADNLGTLWLVRDEMQDGKPFIVLNGDTIFTSDVATRLINRAEKPITLTISVKSDYDEDDMKIIMNGDLLRRVSKKLSVSDVDAESIGFMLFQNEGITMFRDEMEQIMSQPEGLKVFYLSVIDSLAHNLDIGTVETPTDSWQEVDYPADYTKACDALQRWLSVDEPSATTVSHGG